MKAENPGLFDVSVTTDRLELCFGLGSTSQDGRFR